MIQFSFWDILSNLLIATEWTIILSLIAFVSGGIVGLILLFMRTSQSRAARMVHQVLHRVLPGHAAA